MKIGDIVNVKKSKEGYWKGRVIQISEKYEQTLKSGEIISFMYSKPIITVKEISGIGSATLAQKDLEFRDGEYWET